MLGGADRGRDRLPARDTFGSQHAASVACAAAAASVTARQNTDGTAFTAVTVSLRPDLNLS